MDDGTLFALMQQATEAAGTISGGLNWSVSIGDLVSIATTVIGIVAAYTRLTDRLKALEVKSDVLWDDYRRRSRHTRE